MNKGLRSDIQRRRPEQPTAASAPTQEERREVTLRTAKPRQKLLSALRTSVVHIAPCSLPRRSYRTTPHPTGRHSHPVDQSRKTIHQHRSLVKRKMQKESGKNPGQTSPFRRDHIARPIANRFALHWLHCRLLHRLLLAPWLASPRQDSRPALESPQRESTISLPVPAPRTSSPGFARSRPPDASWP
jgi:hypothetical protein